MSNLDRVHEAITDYWRENAIPPTIRAVQHGTGISSTSVIRYYYGKLEERGMIKRIHGKPVPIEIFKLVKGDSPR